MKKVKFIDGPNLNLLGNREPEIYGSETLADIHNLVNQHIKEKNIILRRHFFSQTLKGKLSIVCKVLIKPLMA